MAAVTAQEFQAETLGAPIKVVHLDFRRELNSFERGQPSLWLRVLKAVGLQPRPTQPWVLEQCFQPIFNASTVQELSDSTAEGTQKLQDLGLHDKVIVQITTKERVGRLDEVDISAIDPDAPVECTVHVINKEKKKLVASTSINTSANGRDAGAEANITLHNYFGTAELINYKYNMDKSRSFFYEASFWKPLLFRQRDETVGAEIVREAVNNSGHSSHRLDRLGLMARYMRGQHEVQYELSWRDVSLEDNPTKAMLEEGGQSIKSSIRHSWKADSRNDHLMPTSGTAVHVQNELAGLGGSVRFVKSEVAVQHNVPLTVAQDWALNFLVKSGAHVPFGGSRSHITDRFFLGGPTSFRGFENKGVGPRMKHDSYGGDVYWVGSAHLSGLLRGTQLGTFCGQLFFQAGNNVRLNQWRNVFVDTSSSNNNNNNNGVDAQSGIRTSMGAGLVWRWAMGARLELNYVWPLNASEHDAQKPGAQVGIAANFL